MQYKGQGFDGETIIPDEDNPRLGRQIERVFKAIKDGAWNSLASISKRTDSPESSVSARLRDLRKFKFGSHTIERKRHETGLHLYRLVPS